MVFSGRNRERYFHFLFPEVEVSLCFNILCSCCVFRERSHDYIARLSLSLPACDSQLCLELGVP